jgi:heme-degrading monooxygenase HmoA
VVQDRFSVDDEGVKAFERDSCDLAVVPGDGAEGFFGRFVQRRDATKADDSVNYLVTTMFKDLQSYNQFKSASDPSANLSKAILKSSVIYDAKLDLTSEIGP